MENGGETMEHVEQWFASIAYVSSAGELIERAFATPQLLNPIVLAQLEAGLGALPPGERAGRTGVLRALRRLAARVEQDPSQYPLGQGPLEGLWQQVERREITLAEAERQAARPETWPALTAPVAWGLARVAIQIAQTRSTASGLALQRIVIAAAEAMPADGYATRVRMRALGDGVQLATIALVERPDNEIFRWARRCGAGLLALARASHERESLGPAFFTLGVLYLDAYTTDRPIDRASYERALGEWIERGVPDRAGAPGAHLPPYAEALARAGRYLRRAATLREGRPLALTYKALLQALMFRHHLVAPVDLAEFDRLGAEALARLDPDDDAPAAGAIRAMLDAVHRVPDAPEALDERAFPPLDLDDLLTRHDPVATMVLVLDHVSLWRRRAPAGARRLLEAARPLFERDATEELRTARWDALLACTSSLLGAPPGDGVAGAERACAERAAREAWSPDDLALARVYIAAGSSRSEEEKVGLTLIDRVTAERPDFAQGHDDLLLYVSSALFVGVGLNAYRQGDWPAAVLGYAMGAERALAVRCDHRAADLLGRIKDVVATHGADTPVLARALTIALEEASAQIVLRDDPALLARLRELVPLALSRHGAAGAIDAGSVLALMQLGKGRAFAGRLGVEPPSLRGLPTAVAADLDAIRAGWQRAGEPVESETVLTAWMAPAELAAGATGAEHLDNLRRRVDAALERASLEGASLDRWRFRTLDEVRAAIDERTVVVNLFGGAVAGDELGTIALVVTRDEARAFGLSHGLPAGHIEVDSRGATLTKEWFAPAVESLRRVVLAGPDADPAEADEVLNALGRSLLGGCWEHLAELASAKDHLCVVPHGVRHYVPFHLLGPGDAPLGDSWVVTNLPNLALLRAPAATAAAATVRAFGVPLDATPAGRVSVDEAHAVARIFSIPAEVDGAATREAVLEALRTSRFVHISSHGSVDVAAPAFHRLLLDPAGSFEGSVFALEVMQLDARACEVVTLSACETALGRFDVDDNLCGLPAALFAAGVRAVIGTLWDVDAHASRHFFVEFYTALRDGAGTRDAFGQAQRATRERYPDGRDWGAFQFMGSWT